MSNSKFEWKRLLKGLFSINDSVEWAKTLVGVANIRNILLIGILVGTIAGVGYWKGLKEKPINVGQDLVAYDKEFTIRLDTTEIGKYQDPGLIKPKNSSLLHYGDWRKQILGKPVKVEDIDQLKDKLKPYGFQAKLLFVEGVGSGINNTGVEAGAGIRYARLWQVRADLVGTNRGGYIGFSYKPGWDFVPNSSVGIGMGKGYKGEDRGLLYFSVEL